MSEPIKTTFKLNPIASAIVVALIVGVLGGYQAWKIYGEPEIAWTIPSTAGSGFQIQDNILSKNFYIYTPSGQRAARIRKAYTGSQLNFIAFNQNKPIASTEKKLFSWGTEIAIYDENDVLLGKVKEDTSIEARRGPYWNRFQLLDPQGNLLAVSRLEQIAKHYSIKIFSPDESQLWMTLSFDKPWFAFRQSWDVKILSDLPFDPRLTLFMVPYKITASKS